MNANILPYGNILSPTKLGQAVRTKRKADGLTQAKAAALCGVGVRFISDLENGKSTIELGKALSVLAGLG
ncbi:MAG: helix-turn-helix domain-containing protein, partial [Thiohalomonadales bacterium]